MCRETCRNPTGLKFLERHPITFLGLHQQEVLFFLKIFRYNADIEVQETRWYRSMYFRTQASLPPKWTQAICLSRSGIEFTQRKDCIRRKAFAQNLATPVDSLTRNSSFGYQVSRTKCQGNSKRKSETSGPHHVAKQAICRFSELLPWQYYRIDTVHTGKELNNGL